jgi:hypothetical protein
MNRAIKAATLGVLAVGFALGCGPRPSPSPSATEYLTAHIPIESNASPGAVAVNVDEGQLTPDRRAAFEKLDGPARLMAAVREEMAASDRVVIPRR